MSAPNHVLPLGVRDAELLREQRTAELRVLGERDQHFALDFPRSEIFTDLAYVQAYRSECYHLALVWAFRFFRDADPETEIETARHRALMAVRGEFGRELHEAERSLLRSVARDAIMAKAALARREAPR